MDRNATLRETLRILLARGALVPAVLSLIHATQAVEGGG
jgi:hypothetical protein